MASRDKGYYALVFGASGVSGWSLMQQCLIYPSPTTFSLVIGLTHRPLSGPSSYLPQSSGRLELYSGIDLRSHSLVSQLQKIPSISKVTHVYYTAYTGHGSSFDELKAANVEILKNALEAVTECCPDLQFWSLQTGGKAYGIEFTDHIDFKVPSKETDPRIPEPYASKIFYYPQTDLVAAASKDKSWGWAEIRPDVIVGFVPNGNAMNIAQALGLYLGFWRWKMGENTEVPFPGGKRAWTSKRTDTSQDILARGHLWVSAGADREKVDGKAFNVADGHVVAWQDIWDGICKYFGLTGVGPGNAKTEERKGAKWMLDHRDEWERFEEENGLKKGLAESTTWDFMDAIVAGAKVDRQYDLSRIRSVGFEDEVPTVSAYHIAFERESSPPLGVISG